MDNDKSRILIVDDEVFNLQFLTELLAPDYHINVAKDGKKALELTRTLQPDLIILDVVMPEMDGYKVIKKLKENDSVNHIPVIFLTSLCNSRDEEKGLSLGALDYINKPFHPAIVKARVNNILELVKHRKLIEKIALLDGLTGIPNRRAYDTSLQQQWLRFRDNNTPLSLGFLDIDYFKQYNDSYGHAAGDISLKKVAGVLDGSTSTSGGFAARYGGEEFAFILPSLTVTEAQLVAENICLNVKNLAIEHNASLVAPTLTVSIGGITLLPGHSCQLEQFTYAVDQRLYLAKKTRNTVSWSSM